MDERLAAQLAFALELDKEKSVFRQTHLTGHGRNENDAEHAWHMAIMCYLLREYANETIDVARAMLLCRMEQCALGTQRLGLRIQTGVGGGQRAAAR